MTFEEWMKKVNAAVTIIAGLGVEDLADWDFRSAFDDGESPGSVARAMLAEEGFYA